MRKHFTLGLEAETLARQAQANISMEEEQVMLAEANDDLQEAQTDLAEAERIIEVSDALEDLAVIADGIEEATPAEAALIETAGNMAVAGTDVAPEEVVPAMEGYIGKKISTEGLRETAAGIWQSILKFLKNIWAHIEGFFYKMFGTIPALRSRIEKMLKAIDDAAGKKAEKTKVGIRTGIAALSVAGTPAKNGADLKKHLDVLEKSASFVFGGYIDSVSKVGEAIAKEVHDFDPAKAEECATALRAKLKEASFGSLPGASGADKSRFPGFTTILGAALPGNFSLAHKKFDDNKDSSVLGSLDRFRKSGVELIPTAEKGKEMPAEIEIATLSMSEMNALLKDMEGILDTLEEYKRGKRSKEIVKTKQSIESASAKASKAFESAKKDEEQKGSLPYYKAMLNFNASYARWAQSPAMPLLSHALTTIKATMNVVSVSLSEYK